MAETTVHVRATRCGRVTIHITPTGRRRPCPRPGQESYQYVLYKNGVRRRRGEICTSPGEEERGEAACRSVAADRIAMARNQENCPGGRYQMMRHRR